MSVLLAGLMKPGRMEAALEVHEWGTFTVLQGADGIPLRWYLPAEDQFKLPGFVHRIDRTGLKALADGRATARMETPVLYFYPDKEMNITVRAGLPAGALTEWFPEALRSEPGPPQGNPRTLQWIGQLIQPRSPLTAGIPTAADAAGRHYAAAREVPEAWLFQSALPPARDAAPEIDRMIFYRGAADLAVPLWVKAVTDDRFEIQNSGKEAIKTLYAVQTSGDQVAWTRLERLSPAEFVEGRNLSLKSFALSPAGSRETAIPALRQDMVQSLEKEGLTAAEAAAMVETWRDLWFAETGTRVLAVLPDEWVNEKVPLGIAPAPEKTVRVFVARMEILTPGREQALGDLLTGQEPPEVAAPRLRALELGRFTHGALERTQAMRSRAMECRLKALQSSK